MKSNFEKLAFSTSDNPVVRDAACDRRFMVVHEKAQRIGFVETAHLDRLPIDEAESHISFLESFSVISKELIK